jgi:hypothetical protein
MEVVTPGRRRVAWAGGTSGASAAPTGVADS